MIVLLRGYLKLPHRKLSISFDEEAGLGRVHPQPQRMQGLAYSVSGGFQTTAVDHRGLFVAGGETAAAGNFILALERVLLVQPGQPVTVLLSFEQIRGSLPSS